MKTIFRLNGHVAQDASRFEFFSGSDTKAGFFMLGAADAREAHNLASVGSTPTPATNLPVLLPDDSHKFQKPASVGGGSHSAGEAQAGNNRLNETNACGWQFNFTSACDLSRHRGTLAGYDASRAHHFTTTRGVQDRESFRPQHGGCTPPKGLGWKANKPLMRKPTAMYGPSREGMAWMNFNN